MNKKTYLPKIELLTYQFGLLVLSFFLSANLYAKTPKETFTIGGCLAVAQNNKQIDLASNYLSPLEWVQNAIWRFDGNHRQLWLKAVRDSTTPPLLFSKSYSIKVLQYPKNGKLIIKGSQSTSQANQTPTSFYYVAKDNFLGKDKVIYLIEDEQYKIKYVQNLVVIENVVDDSSEENCMDTGIDYLITQPRNPVPTPEQAVMKRDISVANFYNKHKQVKFIKNQIIDYIKLSNGNLLLVNDYGEKIAWVPVSTTITTEQFSKLDSWQGKSSVGYCGDSICEGKGVALKFNRDGTFYNKDYPKNRGHLYHYQDLVWARNGNEKRFDLSLFKKFKSNNLCAILIEQDSTSDAGLSLILMSATADDGAVEGCY